MIALHEREIHFKRWFHEIYSLTAVCLTVFIYLFESNVKSPEKLQKCTPTYERTCEYNLRMVTTVSS